MFSTRPESARPAIKKIAQKKNFGQCIFAVADNFVFLSRSLKTDQKKLRALSCWLFAFSDK